MAMEVVLALLALLVLYKIFSKKRGPAENLPPGPPPLPLIGNMNQLLGSAPPHHSLRRLAERYGPLMRLTLGQVPAVVVSSSEVAREVMKTHDLAFASRPKALSAEILAYGYSDIGFAPYGPYWRQMRKVAVVELLSTSRVMSYRKVREEEVGLVIKSISAAAADNNNSSPVNLTQTLFCLAHDVISKIAFGKRNPEAARFREITKESVAISSGFDIGDFFPSLVFVRAVTGQKRRLEKIFREFDRITDEIIDAHVDKEKERESEDLVDVLLRVQKDSNLEIPLTKGNMKAVLLDLFIGGSETTSISMEWAMVEMMRNPEVMAKARSEILKVMEGKTAIEESDLRKLKYLKLVMKETLRLHPPLPLLIPRESIIRCTINGYDIPAKTRVIINDWAISRDPAVWENPETFYPERFADSELDFKGFDFVPFGVGRRGCPGILFAMVVFEYSLASLLFHFDWKLPEGVKVEDLEVGEMFGLTVTRESNLFLVPVPRFRTPTV